MQNTKDAVLVATDPIESEKAPAAALVVISGGGEVVFVEGSNVGIPRHCCWQCTVRFWY